MTQETINRPEHYNKWIYVCSDGILAV